MLGKNFKMKYDYGKYSYEEVKKYTNDWFSKIDNIINTDHQSLVFINTILDVLDKGIKEEMKKSTILDWGCATGISLFKLREHCGHNNIYGIDLSENSVKYGTERYKVNMTTKDIDKNYDIILTSNCLEHIKNYEDVMQNHISFCNKYYIVLVPFNGDIKDKIADHIVSFNKHNIPTKINNFSIVQSLLVDFRGNGVWNGFQVLLVYKNDLWRK